jgi:adenylyltransferase/sulfurtransferase
MYLAAAGVGELVLVDFDKVDLSNLQRQIIHTTDRIGSSKVESARQTLLALNPEIRVETLDHPLNEAELAAQIASADLVVDATDNFTTRFAINAGCFAARTPLVSGAAIRLEGQISVFLGQPGGPCYHCLYPEDGEMDETCTANGVLAPVVGIRQYPGHRGDQAPYWKWYQPEWKAADPRRPAHGVAQSEAEGRPPLPGLR